MVEVKHSVRDFDLAEPGSERTVFNMASLGGIGAIHKIVRPIDSRMKFSFNHFGTVYDVSVIDVHIEKFEFINGVGEVVYLSVSALLENSVGVLSERNHNHVVELFRSVANATEKFLNITPGNIEIKTEIHAHLASAGPTVYTNDYNGQEYISNDEYWVLASSFSGVCREDIDNLGNPVAVWDCHIDKYLADSEKWLSRDEYGVSPLISSNYTVAKDARKHFDQEKLAELKRRVAEGLFP